MRRVRGVVHGPAAGLTAPRKGGRLAHEATFYQAATLQPFFFPYSPDYPERGILGSSALQQILQRTQLSLELPLDHPLHQRPHQLVDATQLHIDKERELSGAIEGLKQEVNGSGERPGDSSCAEGARRLVVANLPDVSHSSPEELHLLLRDRANTQWSPRNVLVPEGDRYP